MKVYVDFEKGGGLQEVSSYSDTCIKLIQHDIPEEIFEEDMIRRLKWVLDHKRERCRKRLLDEYGPMLMAQGESIPSDLTKRAEAIFKLDGYLSNPQRAKLQQEREELRRQQVTAQRQLQQQEDNLMSQMSLEEDLKKMLERIEGVKESLTQSAN